MNDLQAINQLTRDLYGAISFEPGGQPELDLLKSLFLPPGLLIKKNEARFKTEGREHSIRGINSIQYLKTEGAWRVASIIWNDEKEDRLIPEGYF